MSKEKLAELQNQLPDLKDLEKLSSFYKIMSDPSRLKLLIALMNGQMKASDVAEVAGLSRSAASHQLKTLKDAKLVRSVKEGQNVLYSLDDDHIYHVLQVAFEHIQEE